MTKTVLVTELNWTSEYSFYEMVDDMLENDYSRN